ncbi:bifunctional hydroxymethylpyrimidine kinase/phosphomethylpyrimidine kinase [Clostridium sp.]|uniref:bifunctional hydroxymethylpyrimidine kinase/phosphomethylpyrimidine kinase n=1 Tax=Clostridium sp. TaxID=1506 RepID=UPI002A90B1A5|nr:bifunctional hydroxymethylpyrimidine kinase/phosphomethylpyrimidine kinase [Clostridium sp.]MDY6013082.1 bifunctional hydroxymethylpyrimidine kinase/phosphomethylpyrimidine kinase [Clostridium sp.]
MYKALSIAGSDCSGGAGIQADLKAFSANGVFGMSVITAITAQNTQGVFGIQDISEDIPKIVLDPVMVSKSGFKLLSEDAKETLIKELFPITTLITPNLPEVEEILGVEIKNIDDMKEAAINLKKLGPKAVLVKGGHLEDDATDILYDGEKFIYLKQERINSKNTHGTGCTLSSAIAANIAKGMNIEDAVREAKRYVTIAIEHGIELGKGVGPTHHFYELYKLANME